MYLYPKIRSLIFKMTPKQAHESTIAMLRLGGSMAFSRAILRAYFKTQNPGPKVEAFGLTFANPLGLASGYDKDGLGWRGLSTLGFGHLELGTVTPRPQPGNPEPRSFRLVEDEAVINRMGFPNRGSDFVKQRMKFRKPKGLILGMNIGKNKVTPNEEAVQDYVSLLKDFASLADYLAINISSPNTPGLRELQGKKYLETLLGTLAEERGEQVRFLGKPVPLIVKLAPDMQDNDLEDALDVILATGMDGVIISNTTISRPDTLQSKLAGETGGLSGKPLTALNTALVKRVYELTEGKLPIIASGGVMDTATTQEKLDAGATLVQLYTGLIYAGPELVRNILDDGLKI